MDLKGVCVDPYHCPGMTNSTHHHLTSLFLSPPSLPIYRRVKLIFVKSIEMCDL